MLDTPSRATQPFTGEEYLESIRDRREVYVYGERVEDVTTHPAFRNTARSIARLYDALHDDSRRAVITLDVARAEEALAREAELASERGDRRVVRGGRNLHRRRSSSSNSQVTASESAGAPIPRRRARGTSHSPTSPRR